MKTFKTAGVLLAGGMSERFGEPKAFYKLNGDHFYESGIQVLQKHTEKIIIVSHPSLYEQFLSQVTYDVIQDELCYQGFGPLAGIYSAMKHVVAERYVILPCDTPYIDEQSIRILLEQANLYEDKDALVPIVDGRKQPLIAIYRPSCIPVIKSMLDQKQLKMGMLLKSVNTLYLEESLFENLASFQNINRKEDLGK